MGNPLVFTRSSPLAPNLGVITKLPQRDDTKHSLDSALSHRFRKVAFHSSNNKHMNRSSVPWSRRRPGFAGCSLIDFITSTSSKAAPLFSNAKDMISDVVSHFMINTQLPGGMLGTSVALFYDLATMMVNQAQLELASNPVVPIATVIVTLTGSAISARSFRDDYNSTSTNAVRKLDNVKMRLTKLKNRFPDNLPEKGLEVVEDGLPLHYDPKAITDYFMKRPALVVSRASFILLECSLLMINILIDSYSGKTKKNEHLRASQLVELISKLGPTAVKIGQALSIRPDLLPAKYIEALQKLQDRVPPFSNEEARKTITEGLGMAIEDIYSEFSNEPIAAASLGQVYKAKLLYSGEAVAVKVQRPRVLETVSLDLYILRAIAIGMQKLPNQSSSNFLSFIDECAAHLFKEFDYIQEVIHNCRSFSLRLSQGMLFSFHLHGPRQRPSS